MKKLFVFLLSIYSFLACQEGTHEEKNLSLKNAESEEDKKAEIRWKELVGPLSVEIKQVEDERFIVKEWNKTGAVPKLLEYSLNNPNFFSEDFFVNLNYLLQNFDLETEYPLKSMNDFIVNKYEKYYNLNDLIEIAILYCNLQGEEFNYAVEELSKRNDVLGDSNLIKYIISDLLSGGVGDLSSKLELNPKLTSEFLQGLEKMENIYSDILNLFKEEINKRLSIILTYLNLNEKNKSLINELISDESKFEPYNIQSTIENLGDIMAYLNDKDKKEDLKIIIKEDLKIIIRLFDQLPRKV